MLIFGQFLEILRPLIRVHCKKNGKNTIIPLICCKFQNLLVDHQTCGSIFILVSNEMVNTGNHTFTMLIFSLLFPNDH